MQLSLSHLLIYNAYQVILNGNNHNKKNRIKYANMNPVFSIGHTITFSLSDIFQTKEGANLNTL